MPSRTSGWALRSSTATKAAISAAATASRPIVRADAQPYSCAFTIPYTSTTRPPVMVTAPARSNPRRPWTRDSGTMRTASSAVAIPTGTFTKKIQRQETYSVRIPPSSMPTAPPPTAIVAHTPMARVRSRPSANVVVTIESAAGETSAAPRPCRARAAMRTFADGARPSSTDAAVNTTTPARKRRRRPNRSAARPPRSRNPPKSRV